MGEAHQSREPIPQKQMASGAGGGATDAIIVRPELGEGETGLGIAKHGRRSALRRTGPDGRRIQAQQSQI
ncbi:hypothetical protein A8A54_04040 [Brucella pseudogrignonensis]|nr:hypothetical protein A8A54_04040 [Brucella pseudogrignonensis]